MNFVLRLFCSATACLIAATAASADDEQLERKIDRLIERQGFTDDEPGVAVLVYQPGRISFRKGYGSADLKAETPITPRTPFELASNTKPFTATSVLLLAERGKLSLDDDVRTYVPELPVYRGGPIRIRNLLNHTSGLPEYLDFEEDVAARHGTWWNNDDYLVPFVRHAAEFPAGRRYEYNNSNYLLLATIIARVSKKSYGTFLRDEIFAPLGMKHTFVYESPTSPPQPAPGFERAVGYERGKKQTWKAGWGSPPARHETSLTVGDGGIWTNLEDMAAWDAAQRRATLLSAATLQSSRRPSRTADGERNDYGFGWELEVEEGRLIGYGHSGVWGGFRTSYYRDLTNDRTIVILSNRGNFDPDDLWEALDALVTKHLDR